MAFIKSDNSMDTRRKLTYYVHPDDYTGDKMLCEKLSSLEKSEKSRLLRAATIAGFALFMQDERLPYLLTELLDENTTMIEIMQIIGSIKPEAASSIASDRQDVTQALLQAILAQLGGLNSGSSSVVDSSKQQLQHDEIEEETRRNAQNMFNIPK